MRYHLYAIDRIISRTISWTILTGLLALGFGLSVLALQAMLAPMTGDNAVAVAASTLIAAASFQPLRVGVQRNVDRRFQRSQLDRDRLIQAFGNRLRSEVDLDTIEGQMLATIDAVLQPDGAMLWERGQRVCSQSEAGRADGQASGPTARDGEGGVARRSRVTARQLG
jgi:hypothetical protein